MKIFGLNILTDKGLDRKIAEFNFDRILKIMKIKKLYMVIGHRHQKPKCDLCNENRQFVTTLPDGKVIKSDCSCAKWIKKYSYIEDPTKYNICISKFDNNIWLFRDREPLFVWDERTINNLEKPQECNLYTTKKLAQKAVNILNKKEREK